MISPSDIEYVLTKKIKKGISQLEFPFNSLSQWIYDNFGVSPINIIYDLLPHDKRPRLQVIFDRQSDYALFVSKNGLFPDKTKESQILDRFISIVADLPDYKVDNIFLVFSSFERVAKEEVNSFVPNTKVNSIKDKIDLEIWEIHKDFNSVVFFFFTNEQLDKYSNDGLTINKLTDLYFDLLKEYDEFDYLDRKDFKIQLDSKENFDTKYQSNWFYYSRR